MTSLFFSTGKLKQAILHRYPTILRDDEVATIAFYVLSKVIVDSELKVSVSSMNIRRLLSTGQRCWLPLLIKVSKVLGSDFEFNKMYDSEARISRSFTYIPNKEFEAIRKLHTKCVINVATGLSYSHRETRKQVNNIFTRSSSLKPAGSFNSAHQIAELLNKTATNKALKTIVKSCNDLHSQQWFCNFPQAYVPQSARAYTAIPQFIPRASRQSIFKDKGCIESDISKSQLTILANITNNYSLLNLCTVELWHRLNSYSDIPISLIKELVYTLVFGGSEAGFTKRTGANAKSLMNHEVIQEINKSVAKLKETIHCQQGATIEGIELKLSETMKARHIAARIIQNIEAQIMLAGLQRMEQIGRCYPLLYLFDGVIYLPDGRKSTKNQINKIETAMMSKAVELGINKLVIKSEEIKSAG